VPATIPPPAPVRPDPDDVRRYGARIGAGPVLKVGLVWGSTDPNRCVPPAALAPLGAVPGIRFFGLQAGPGRATAGTPPLPAFEDLGAEIADFADLAAAMACLDLIVTADTGPAHLSGCLGVPTWVLLPAPADWVWGLTGERTPWYPTARAIGADQSPRRSCRNSRAADELRRLSAQRRYGGLPLVGLRGTDERGSLVSWMPERPALARS